MFRFHAVAVFGVGLALVLMSCSDGKLRQSRQDADAASPAGAHWVHSADLTDVMARLERQRANSWPQEIQDEYAADAEKERQLNLVKANSLAQALARAAEMIPQALENVKLSSADRKLFLSYVGDLRDEAQKLTKLTEEKDLEGIAKVQDDIRTTCNACHKQFRELAGPLG